MYKAFSWYGGNTGHEMFFSYFRDKTFHWENDTKTLSEKVHNW